MISDIRIAARSLGRSPGLAVSAVLLLGIGIGLSVVFYGVAYGVLFRELPVERPDELVRIGGTESSGRLLTRFPEALVGFLEERSTILAPVFAWAESDALLSDSSEPRLVRVHAVNGGFFEALGVNCPLGREITSADDRPDQPLIAVLSEAFWRQHYGADPHVLGRVVHLGDHQFVIAGVAPKGFLGLSLYTGPDFWVPLRAKPLLGEPSGYSDLPSLGGRLRTGVAIEQARSEVQALREALLASDSEFRRRWMELRIELDPMAQGMSELREQFRRAAVLLLAGAVFLMMLVYANVGGLLLARSASKRQEWAVRLAVGASRWRLGRLILAEALLFGWRGSTRRSRLCCNGSSHRSERPAAQAGVKPEPATVARAPIRLALDHLRAIACAAHRHGRGNSACIISRPGWGVFAATIPACRADIQSPVPAGGYAGGARYTAADVRGPFLANVYRATQLGSWI